MNIVLSPSFNICFGWIKEPSRVKMVLLSTYNICFSSEIRKLIFIMFSLSIGLYVDMKIQ